MLDFLYKLLFATTIAAWISFAVAYALGSAGACFFYIGFTYSGAGILSWLLHTMIAPLPHTIYEDV